MAKRIREKAKRRQENKDKRPRAVARYVRISPFKVREVLDIIRNKRFEEALTLLQSTQRAAAPIIEKVLLSAAANAENNLEMSRDTLVVAEAYCDEGPTLKRIRARAQGRAFRILKRTSHITIILDDENNIKGGHS